MYDSKQILLKSMIKQVGVGNIREIWKITDVRPENKNWVHFIIIVDPISYLCSCMSNISRGIICRHYFRVMMVSMVAGFQIQMIPSRWYIDQKKDEDLTLETCHFVNQEAVRNFSGMNLIPNPSTVPMTVNTVLRCAAKKKVKYGEVWGLARQAAQLAVDHGNHSKMIEWLREFINSHQEVIALNTGSVRNRDLLELSEIHNEGENKENEPNEHDQVNNPSVSRRKGRPETKRYKSATERKPRAKYTCSTCGQAGHNSARCQQNRR